MRVFYLILVLIFYLLFYLFKSGFVLAQNNVNMTLNISKVWWGDGVLASGSVFNSTNGSVSDVTVRVQFNNTVFCSATSNSTGGWSCGFAAPNETGSYQLDANISNTKFSATLTVAPNYGEKPSGTTERTVYEQPMLIQEPTGKIQIVFVRVLVWRR